jgi:hypothetical protein
MGALNHIARFMPPRAQVRAAARTIAHLVLLGFLALTPGFMASQWAHAQGNTARLTVTARIATFFQLQVGFQAPVLVVTGDDIARGYVDVDAATAFTVTTNTLDPYLVDFRPVNPVFSAVVVSGLGTPVQIGADGGMTVYRAPHGRIATHQLAYRFILNKGLLPGTYPWPLQMSVRAA